MKITRRRMIGWVGTAAALGGIGLSPVLAQQASPQVLPPPIQHAGEEKAKVASSQDVTLTADGSLRAMVVTAEGRSVPGAQLILTRYQADPAEPEKLVTGVEGQALATGIQPGLYQVSVDAHQGEYKGTLRVWEDGTAPGSIQQVAEFCVSDSSETAGQEPCDDQKALALWDCICDHKCLIGGGLLAAGGTIGIIALSHDPNEGKIKGAASP